MKDEAFIPVTTTAGINRLSVVLDIQILELRVLSLKWRLKPAIHNSFPVPVIT
jgi:hypothetical protein